MAILRYGDRVQNITMKQTLLLCCLLHFLCVSSQAQNTHDHSDPQRNCAAMNVLEQQLRDNPEMAARRAAIETQTERLVAEYQRNPTGTRGVITIPVVVHVLYRTDAENISDAQIQSQIDVLNQDFRKINAESVNIPDFFKFLAADVEINFCLAKRDPMGKVSNGIERKYTSTTSWSSNDDMKRTENGGLAVWNTGSYLNLWCCNIGSGILGYGQFPGGPASTDGVVIDYRYFGSGGATIFPFNRGRTATHEVGHWLNLLHIWGDARCGSDGVNDTPAHHGANYGCPSFPYYNSSCGANTIEMTMNFMDYTNDACMYLFSAGQKARMLALFDAGMPRASLLYSNGCTPVTTPSPVCSAVPQNVQATAATAIKFNLFWLPQAAAASYQVEYWVNNTNTFNSVNTNVNTLQINGLRGSTTYAVRVKSICANGIESAYSNLLYVTTPPAEIIITPLPVVCAENSEPNNTRSSATRVAINASMKSQIGTLGDRDWFTFRTIGTATNVRLTLSELPADYDLKLYNVNGALLRSSENMGTATEIVLYNTSTTGDYFVQIYGYNAAYNIARCYNLNIETAGSSYREVFRAFPVDYYSKGLRIYPNPTSGILMLDFEPEADETATLQICDVLGKICFQQNIEISKVRPQYEVNLSDLPDGMYVLNLRGQHWNKQQKIVKY
jgi:Secretion system C-terminal sorting domain/Pregnancy-associated plasma protein-A/Fibronectin type III domain